MRRRTSGAAASLLSICGEALVSALSVLCLLPGVAVRERAVSMPSGGLALHVRHACTAALHALGTTSDLNSVDLSMSARL